MHGLCVTHLPAGENTELPKGAHRAQELLWLGSMYPLVPPWRGFAVGRAACMVQDTASQEWSCCVGKLHPESQMAGSSLLSPRGNKDDEVCCMVGGPWDFRAMSKWWGQIQLQRWTFSPWKRRKVKMKPECTWWQPWLCHLAEFQDE